MGATSQFCAPIVRRFQCDLAVGYPERLEGEKCSIEDGGSVKVVGVDSAIVGVDSAVVCAPDSTCVGNYCLYTDLVIHRNCSFRGCLFWGISFWGIQLSKSI
jgi:hypothetical protein